MCNNKKNIKTIMLIVIMFCCVSKVNADTCSTTEKKDLIKSAKNIEIIAYLDEEYNPYHEYNYNVYLTNFTSDYYIIDSLGNRFEYEQSYTDDSVFGVYEPGSKVSFKIYGSYDGKCPNVLLTTSSIKFDYYNDYSTRKECEGIEEFYLCKRNYSGDIESEEWFLSQIEGYKNGTVDNVEDIEDDDESFLSKYKAIVIILIVVVIIALILLIVHFIKNRNKIKIKFKEDKDRSEYYEKDK